MVDFYGLITYFSLIGPTKVAQQKRVTIIKRMESIFKELLLFVKIELYSIFSKTKRVEV